MKAKTASLFVLGSFVVACSAKVAHLPRRGESLRAESFTVEPGGKGLNLALGALRLGATVDGLFPIGNDFFAQLAEVAFEQSGLPMSMLRRFDGTTGSGIGFADGRGENCLAVHPGANMLLDPRDVRHSADALRAAKLVLAQFEIGDEPILEAFSLARDAGVRTLLNPSPFRPIDPGILERTSILIVNEVEASRICGAICVAGDEGTPNGFPGLAAALLRFGVEIVIVTLGAAGAVAFQRNSSPIYQPGFLVEAVDTLGAGDAFSAGLATSLVGGHTLKECLTIARACGAITCQRIGVFDALPSRAELNQFLLSHACKSLA